MLRSYELPDGTLLPSVTTILKAVNKPNLVDWAARLERDLVIEAAADLHEDLPSNAPKLGRLGYVTTLRNRLPKQRAHQSALADAGDIGTELHRLIEWNIRRELGQVVGPQPSLRREAAFAFSQYEQWRAEVHLRPLLIEQRVWSRTHGFAGTMDLYAEITLPGYGCIQAVLDWKTGKALYPEHELQNAAYVHALGEMHHAPAGPIAGVLVRFPKFATDPGFETRVLTPEGQQERLDAFLHVLGTWKWLHQQDPAAREQEVIRSIPDPVTHTRAAATNAAVAEFSFAG